MRQRRCWWCGAVIDCRSGAQSQAQCSRCLLLTPVAPRPVLNVYGEVTWAGVDVGEVKEGRLDGTWEGRMWARKGVLESKRRRDALDYVIRQTAAWLYRNVGG